MLNTEAAIGMAGMVLFFAVVAGTGKAKSAAA
jgi:hypothetical protein